MVTADCKGVPLVRSALGSEEAAEPPLPAVANQRRGKGEKANKKRMAAVGAVYAIDPFVRTADEVIDEVMRKKAAKRRLVPAHKRVRAELLVGKVALFLWLADEVLRRNPEGGQTVGSSSRTVSGRCRTDRMSICPKTWSVSWICST